MKVSIRQEAKPFNPFDLVFRFETKEEAIRFHHLFNSVSFNKLMNLDGQELRCLIKQGLGVDEVDGWRSFAVEMAEKFKHLEIVRDPFTIIP